MLLPSRDGLPYIRVLKNKYEDDYEEQPSEQNDI
jgi:hypothetical protein